MSAWPSVLAWMVTRLPTMPAWSGVEVFDGPPVTSDAPASFVTVGFVPGEDFAGSFEPTEQLGDFVEETGTIRSEIVCASGDTDLSTVRARAFALFDAWEAEVRRDHTLGGLVADASLTVDVQPRNVGGASQRLVVTLSYLARS